MSISRLILRSLFCNAFLRQPYDPDEVTMAGTKVFDSLLNPLQFDINKSAVPSIVVYTDEDERKVLNRASNSGPMMRHIDVRVELAIGSFQTVVYEDEQGREKKGVAQALPTTDPEMEAKLDLFEQQVHWAVMYYVGRPASDALKQYVVTLEEISSAPHRDESGNNRLAVRRINYRCRVNDDCPPPIRYGVSSAPNVSRLTEDDFPVAPWLKKVMVAMQDQPGFKNVIDALGGRQSVEVVSWLKTLGVTVDCVWPANASKLAALNRVRGPDGQIEAYALWEL